MTTDRNARQNPLDAGEGSLLGSNVERPQPHRDAGNRQTVGAAKGTRENDKGVQNATSDPLSAKQHRAIEALVAGRTVTDAAKSARVHRTTVHDWLKSPEFRAELNRRRLELCAAERAGMIHTARKARKALDRALDSGDHPELAFRVLQGMGLLRLLPIGHDDPNMLRHEARQREIALDGVKRLDAAGQLAGPVALRPDSDY
jgi:hypothetical protein